MCNIEDTLILAIDFQTGLMPAIYNYEELNRKIEIFLKGCRILELPILVTQQYTKGLGDTLPNLKNILGEFTHIEKITFSCCKNAEFISKLNESGKKNILVTGIEAHICVQQTVLDLLAEGYNVCIIADGIGSRSETDRIYSEKRMRQAGATVTTVESALFEFLKTASHPKRKEISNLVR